jgi:hypothetical protein
MVKDCAQETTLPFSYLQEIGRQRGMGQPVHGAGASESAGALGLKGIDVTGLAGATGTIASGGQTEPWQVPQVAPGKNHCLIARATSNTMASPAGFIRQRRHRRRRLQIRVCP